MTTLPRKHPVHDPVLAPADRLADRTELARLLGVLPWLDGAPEPFKRLRPGWPRLVGDVVDHAESAATELRRLR
ncbi:hypothetical protein GCM10023080_003590 [Streptomyces pseudoechinosporeus]